MGFSARTGLRFAFYGRVSTEDWQDPVASRARQRDQAAALVAGHGRIVAEFFDVGYSRALAWARRPQAAALVAALADPDRGWDAIVIGEYERAFYGSQYASMAPLLEHYDIQLWTPEVGGRIDYGTEDHEQMMLALGYQSRREIARTKIRVRTAMATQTREQGRYLGGRPPYGYRLADAGPHPNKAHAAATPRRGNTAGCGEGGGAIARRMPEPSQLPVVARTTCWLGWHHHFGPASGSDPKSCDLLGRYCVTVFTGGVNIGQCEAATHIAGVSARELSMVRNRHIDLGKLLCAAIAAVVSAFAELDVVQAWGDGTAVAADGMHVEAYIDNLAVGADVGIPGLRPHRCPADLWHAPPPGRSRFRPGPGPPRACLPRHSGPVLPLRISRERRRH